MKERLKKASNAKADRKLATRKLRKAKEILAEGKLKER